MDNLPIEVVEQITKHLEPQDLARLCAVSRLYYELFNRDCFWKPHCDSKLEEPLRTAPCFVEPKFDIAVTEDSILSPICKWRQAFLRENHLWYNWKTGNYKEVTIPKLSGECFRHFLTNYLIIRVSNSGNRIEIWDVSVIPADLVVGIAVNLPCCGFWSVVGTNKLVFKAVTFIQVYHIDIINKCVNLKHHTEVEETGKEKLIFHNRRNSAVYNNCERLVVKGNIFLHWNKIGSKLRIFDLDSGVMLKEEPCPVETDVHRRANIVGLLTSTTCCDVVVVVEIEHFPHEKYHSYHIYSPIQLRFLPCAATNLPSSCNQVEVHGHYIAVRDRESVMVFDYRTSQVVFKQKLFCNSIKGFSDRFIFISLSNWPHLDVISFFCEDNKTSLETFFYDRPKVVGENNRISFRKHTPCLVKNNKFLIFHEWRNQTWDLWEASGRSLKRSEIPYDAVRDRTVNDVMTVVSHHMELYNFFLDLRYYW